MSAAPRTASGGRSPSVSIVLATNRDSPYLEETLESVRAQTMQDWELLIVDNGVPHPERIEQLIEGDDRMSRIRIESSATAGVARNVGVSRTTADLITFLDDDDVWVPERLERHLHAHSTHPTSPATFSGYRHIDSEGRPFGNDWRSRQTDSAAILSGRADTPLGPTLVIRRHDFTAIGGFSSEIPILVDFELALRLALRGDFVYLDALLVGYRRHAANMTSTAPANALLRRRAMEDMVDRQRWAAAGRGDAEAAELFRERLERFRRSEARLAGTALFRFVKRRDYHHARSELAWGLSRAPITFMLTVATAPLAKARSLLRRRRRP
ncbi:glycosyltransferase family A protein [Microbacterium sp.]|uniref:glycosyltransferase family A protein n=1 Tax=Microbacterium sp. TaxID=51671 RepID=UPI00281221A4|nr:glycosyltransferase family A protein [Microbacterium sp.]